MKWSLAGLANSAPDDAPGETLQTSTFKIPTRPHADRIADALPEVAYSGASPVIDRTLVILAFVNRSGSNYLGDYLKCAEGLGGFREALNWKEVLKTARGHGINSFPDVMQHLAVTEGGTFGLGVKATGPQIAMLVRWKIPAMFSAVKVVHIRREDPVAQAVSLHFAKQTGNWSSMQERRSPDQPVPYDFDTLAETFKFVLSRNVWIEQVCSAAGLDRHSVMYEHLTSRPDQCMVELLTFLGLDASGYERPAQTRFAKQVSAGKAEMVRRFRADLAARMF